MLKQTRTVVVVLLGLAIALAYCDRPRPAPTDHSANQSAVRETKLIEAGSIPTITIPERLKVVPKP